MANAFQIEVYNRRQEKEYQGVFATPVLLGRQRNPREPPYTSTQEGEWTRLTIAHWSESDAVMKFHAVLEPLAPDRVRLSASVVIGIRLPDGSVLKPGCSCELALPAVIEVGRRTVRIQAAETAAEGQPPVIADGR
jgi:hypothetical protein